MAKFVDWEECLESGKVRKTEANEGLIRSLLRNSKDKLKFAKDLDINKDNASFVFTNFYDCLRILSETLGLKEGFKIYNHKCITQFLKTVLEEDKASRVFNDCRIMRNKVNYYGKMIGKAEAEKRISDITEIYQYLKEKYF